MLRLTEIPPGSIAHSLEFVPDPSKREIIAKQIEHLPYNRQQSVPTQFWMELFRNFQQDGWLDPGQMRRFLSLGWLPGSTTKSAGAYVSRLEMHGRNATPQLLLPIDLERQLITIPFRLWTIEGVMGMVEGGGRWGMGGINHRRLRLLNTSFKTDITPVIGRIAINSGFNQYQERLAV